MKPHVHREERRYRLLDVEFTALEAVGAVLGAIAAVGCVWLASAVYIVLLSP